MKTLPKYIALAIACTVFLLVGCAAFEAQVAKLKTDLSALVSNPTSATNQAAVASDVTAIVGDAQTAYNDISGFATVYQAYVGTGLPVPAKVASAAASAAKFGSAVQTVLSKVEATQAVANGLFAAAALAQPTSAMLDPDNQVNNLSRRLSKQPDGVTGRGGWQDLMLLKDHECLTAQFISESHRPAIASDWRFVVASRDRSNF